MQEKDNGYKYLLAGNSSGLNTGFDAFLDVLAILNVRNYLYWKVLRRLIDSLIELSATIIESTGTIKQSPYSKQKELYRGINNELHQRCTMAPTLLNLYACVQ